MREIECGLKGIDVVGIVMEMRPSIRNVLTLFSDGILRWSRSLSALNSRKMI